MARASRSPGLQFENEVRRSFKLIGLKDVGGGPDFRIGEFQVDACGGWDDVFLIAECTQSGSGNASIHDLISEVRGKQQRIRHTLRNLEEYRHYRRFEFAIITRNISWTQGDKGLAAQRPRVHLIDSQHLSYYQHLSSLIGIGALFNFLGELGVEPNDITLPRLPAFRVRVDKNLYAYQFWCQPEDLLQVAYVARRELGRDKYYQRMLTSSRLGKIGGFINKGNIFPNNIIIAFDKKPSFRPKPKYDVGWPPWVDFGEIVFPKSYRSCWVIDGQHRLYAYGRLNPIPKTQKLSVFAFEPIPEYKQAGYFISINKEQKPVSLDLIWDLEGEMSPETPRGRIANCVKRLNSIPPLTDKIFLPLSGESKRGQLKMSGVCTDIQDIGLLNDRSRYMLQTQRNPIAHRINLEQIPERGARAISSFLDAIKNQVSVELWESILLRPGGLTVALNVYEHVLIKLQHMPAQSELETYSDAFAKALRNLASNSTEVRQLVRNLTSYYQRRYVTGELLSSMREELSDDDFGKAGTISAEPLAQRITRFERRLAEVVVEKLQIKDMNDLKQRIHTDVSDRVAGRITQIERERNTTDFPIHMAFTLGEIREIILRTDNAEILMPLFADSVDGFGDRDAVLSALRGITRYRNDILHGRRGGNRRLIIAYLETFERLIG